MFAACIPTGLRYAPENHSLEAFMRIPLLILALTIVAHTAFAIESPSLETGKVLFESPYLGTSGKSCSTCHPEGQGLAGTVKLDASELIKTINICIRKPLKGQPFDPASTEMGSMRLYVRHLYPETP